MATQALISVDEYLRTNFDPDCDYVRGVVTERSMPTYDHAAWQAILIRWFGNHEHEWGIRVMPELRTRISADEIRIPDVTILSRTAPREQVITFPPLAVFEILSPSDTMTGMLERLESYEQMGIPAIWIIDPKSDQESAASWQYSSGHLTPASVFKLPGTDFRVAISEIAALLD